MQFLKKRLVLFFTITGLLVTNKSFSQLSKVGFDRDSSQLISLTDFNHRVNRAIQLLETKKITAISDTDHVNIMMCLNTIIFTPISHRIDGNRFTGHEYLRLEKIADKKNYVRDIIKVYPDYKFNRGMGYYFPSLKMELYGTPNAYALFEVSE